MAKAQKIQKSCVALMLRASTSVWKNGVLKTLAIPVIGRKTSVIAAMPFMARESSFKSRVCVYASWVCRLKESSITFDIRLSRVFVRIRVDWKFRRRYARVSAASDVNSDDVLFFESRVIMASSKIMLDSAASIMKAQFLFKVSAS